MNRVQDTMLDRKLNQANAARIMGVSQPDLSRMLKGRFRDVSVERIMRMLSAAKWISRSNRKAASALSRGFTWKRRSNGENHPPIFTR